MDTLTHLFSIVAPVFICAGIGVVWARLNRPFDSALITQLVYNIGAPCLIVATFAKVRLDPAAMAQMALAVLVCFAAFAAFGAAAIRMARLDIPSYLPSLMFPLTGSMGLPVCYFAFGDEGLALALVYFVIGAVGTFTVGDAIAAGSASLGRLARTPVIYAVAIAVAFQVAGLDMPRWVLNTTGLVGGIVIPAQLIALGISLASLRVATLTRSLALAVLRLAGGAAIGWAVAEAFGLAGPAWAVVVLQSAMPVAVSNYLFAVRHGRKPDEVAGMVLISTLISFATLPLLLLWVL